MTLENYAGFYGFNDLQSLSAEQRQKLFLNTLLGPLNAGGFISIEWFIPNKNFNSSKPISPRNRRYVVRSRRADTVDAAVNVIQRLQTKTETRDIFYVTVPLTQTRTIASKQTGRASFEVPLRSGHTITERATLAVDLDVKAGGYETTEDAIAAFKAFMATINLPSPTAVVYSGTGGVHLHWKLQIPLPREEWQALANSFACALRTYEIHCDTCCTTDIVRILRVPDTHNFKKYDETGEKLPVEFIQLRTKPVDNDAMRAALEPFIRKEEEAFAACAVIPGQQATLRDIDRVARHCGWVRESLDNGGVNNGHMLRFNAYHLSTFCENTDEVAMRLVSKRETLEPGEAEEGIEAAKLKRSEVSIGFPRCSTISNNGAEACKTCPHLARNRSPLNIEGVLPPLPTAPNVASILKNGNVPEVDAFFDEAGEPRWEYGNKSKLSNTYRNAHIALRLLNPAIALNTFTREIVIENNIASEFVLDQSFCGPIKDLTIGELRLAITSRFNFDPGRDNIAAAVEAVAAKNQFNPVTDYLDGLVYHGEASDKLLDTWVVTCLGCEDTPLNRAFGRYFIIGATMRAYYPGSKFDNLLILEMPLQGSGKSTVGLKLVGGVDDRYFSEVDLFAPDKREVVEQIQGVWIGEVSEMSGYSKRDAQHSKRVISTTSDKARLAYARYPEKFDRMGVQYATTNESTYLTDATGNRRYWPIRCGVNRPIDHARIETIRDDIFAAAANHLRKVVSVARSQGYTITTGRRLPVGLYSHFTIPSDLWGAAEEAQEARRVVTKLEDDLIELLDETLRRETEKKEDGTYSGFPPRVKVFKDTQNRIVIRSKDLMKVLNEETKKEIFASDVSKLMEKLGWEKPDKIYIEGRYERGYRKLVA